MADTHAGSASLGQCLIARPPAGVDMRTLKITLAYDGTRFVGWQRQADGESIQGLLEDALARFEGGPVTAHGAGRTDAGVHALGQVASARVTCTHDARTLTKALNAHLPADVRVVSVEDADETFHARFSACGKTYRYEIRNTAIADPFDRAFVWHLPEPLSLDAMAGGRGAARRHARFRRVSQRGQRGVHDGPHRPTIGVAKQRRPADV